jgi:hypothetical protein
VFVFYQNLLNQSVSQVSMKAKMMKITVSWDATPCCMVTVTKILEERAASNFRAEE